MTHDIHNIINTALQYHFATSHPYHLSIFLLFSVSGVGGGAQGGGVFDRDQREIFETRRLELVALGKVRVVHVQYVRCSARTVRIMYSV